MGFDPYDTGDLAHSWRQQPGSPAYCTNLDLKNLETAIRSAHKEVMPGLRDEAYRKMSTADKQMDWKSLVRMLRETYANPSKQTGLEAMPGTSSTTTTTTA